jgi:excisionase family DNA binding protein
MTDRLLTPADVAERCQISTKTVLRAIHRGRLRASRLGEHQAYRMREADIEDWIERCMLEIQPPRRSPEIPTGGRAEPTTVGRLTLTHDMGRP